MAGMPLAASGASFLASSRPSTRASTPGAPVTGAVTQHLPSKTERIGAEWGFADEKTAAAMMKRAKRMRPDKSRTKKLRSDAEGRLMLFHKVVKCLAYQVWLVVD
eukprot:m.220041 g.220041  ORF g.220041 m.220041 type:complete len:105 (+) comp18700_c0_seq12:3271-3585(+)